MEFRHLVSSGKVKVRSFDLSTVSVFTWGEPLRGTRDEGPGKCSESNY